MVGPEKASPSSESSRPPPTIAAQQPNTSTAMSNQTPLSTPSAAASSSHPSSTSSSGSMSGAPPTIPRAHASSSSSASEATILPPPKPSYIDAVRTLRPGDLATVHQKPCARESLLTGIGAGFGMGGLRFILGSGVPFQARQYRAMSWAVGAFVLTSASAHVFCQRRRTLEKNAMAAASAIMEEKRQAKLDEATQLRDQRKRVALEKEDKAGGLWKWVGWR